MRLNFVDFFLIFDDSSRISLFPGDCGLHFSVRSHPITVQFQIHFRFDEAMVKLVVQYDSRESNWA